MSWTDLSTTNPWAVTNGMTYYFGAVVPAAWTADDLRKVLTAPSMAGIWQITSIHPGSPTGVPAIDELLEGGPLKAYDVLAVWKGPDAQISDTNEIKYPARYVWEVGGKPAATTTPPTPPPDASAAETMKATHAAVGSALLGALIGFALGSFLYLDRAPTHAYARANPVDGGGSYASAVKRALTRRHGLTPYQASCLTKAFAAFLERQKRKGVGPDTTAYTLAQHPEARRLCA